MKDENIDEKNFRKYAKLAVKRYYEKNMLVDGMFWSHIVGLYERVWNSNFIVSQLKKTEFTKSEIEHLLKALDCIKNSGDKKFDEKTVVLILKLELLR